MNVTNTVEAGLAAAGLRAAGDPSTVDFEKGKLRAGKKGFKFSNKDPGFLSAKTGQRRAKQNAAATALEGIGQHFDCAYGDTGSIYDQRSKNVRDEANALADNLRNGREVRSGDLRPFKDAYDNAFLPVAPQAVHQVVHSVQEDGTGAAPLSASTSAADRSTVSSQQSFYDLEQMLESIPTASRTTRAKLDDFNIEEFNRSFEQELSLLQNMSLPGNTTAVLTQGTDSQADGAAQRT